MERWLFLSTWFPYWPQSRRTFYGYQTLSTYWRLWRRSRRLV